QPKRGHRIGHDAILLAAAVPAQPDERAAEFGSGVGAASLALLARVPGIDVTLFEIDPALCALAQENIARNGFSDRARAVEQDATAPMHSGPFDHVLMNPPFNDDRLQPSPDAGRRLAHAAGSDLLPRWIGSAHAVLRDHGKVTLIWRADGLAAILREFEAAGFGSASVLPVHPAPGRAAIRIVAVAEKGGVTPTCTLPPLFLNDNAQRPSPEAEAILRQGAALPVSRQTI
ncbi:MAG: tRNA1(Val) (adenine(37)-N6)-methyltransferase, partial [Pseudorhodoplanes sp.]